MTRIFAAIACTRFARQTATQIVCFCLLAFLANTALAQRPHCRSTATGDLHVEHMASRIFSGDHVLRVWLPPGYSDPANSQRAYPVLYMLDAQNLFDGGRELGHVG